MIKEAVYVLNEQSHSPSIFGWDKLTFIERRVSRTLTFKRQDKKLPPATVSCNEYEWIAFTHSDQGYVTINEDEFEAELYSGCYELHNWDALHNDSD